MSTCTVIGAKGFIGSAIAAEAARRGYKVTAVDLDNYDACRGTPADLVINANGNSRKFIDERDPQEGFELSVVSVMRALRDFPAGRHIQISSGAIYPREDDPRHNREDTPLSPTDMSHYGFHKRLAEQLVRHYAPRHLIVRLSGLVGPGLRKNAVYDLLTGGPLFVHPDSEFQYMDTRDLARALFDLDQMRLPAGTLLNLSATGVVSVRQMAGWAGVELPAGADDRPRIRAELNVARAAERLELPTTAETVQRFIREVREGTLTLA
ncbi:MAG: SDR family oxidoreductase [Lentisphaerae bacterium]|jgi:nucleoside-diphosphate-sugar epimerase|nr:SDR family oxidoreductase [Lentisphaerota bacterium]